MKEIPSGINHIEFLSQKNSTNRKNSEIILKTQKEDLNVLDISLEALYIVATCHRKCHGGRHILEVLAARIYNLSCASYSLLCIGYYDEALNLVRSVGEVGNLLALSVHNKTKFAEWLESDKRQRIREFSPAKVRDLLKDSELVLMNEDQYSSLCESYTHITPSTSPNNFNKESKNVCGGIVQEKGLSEALEQLTNIVAMIALLYCKYFKLNDIFDRLVSSFSPNN